MSPESLGREAWEELAPTWPPGSIEGNECHWFNCESYVSPEDAWDDYENMTDTSRKQYTEDIAIRLVREAARLKFGVCDVQLNCCGPNGAFVLMVEAFGPEPRARTKGPTLCDAALACIRALEAQP